MMQTAAALVALLLLASAAGGAAANSESLTYDTESCREETGERLFVRLPAGYEFAFPVDVPTRLGLKVPDPTGLPRDEGEPEGCPANPAMMDRINLGWHAGLGDPAAGPLEADWFVYDFLVMARVGEFEIRPTRPEKQYLEKFERLEALGPPRAVVRRIADGLMSARIVDQHPQDWPVHEGMGALLAEPGAHEEFAGLPWGASCIGTVFKGGVQFCTVSYAMSCDLFVAYRFRQDIVGEENALDLDRQVRAFLRRHALDPALLEAGRVCR